MVEMVVGGKTRTSGLRLACCLGVVLWCTSASWAEERMLLLEPATYRAGHINWHVKSELVVSFRPVAVIGESRIPLSVQQWPFQENLVAAILCKRFQIDETEKLQWVVSTINERVTLVATRNDVDPLDGKILWREDKEVPGQGGEGHTESPGELQVSLRGPLPTASFSCIAGQLIESPVEALRAIEEISKQEDGYRVPEGLKQKRATLQIASTFVFSTDGQLRGQCGDCSQVGYSPHVEFEAVRCRATAFSATCAYDKRDGPPPQDPETGKPVSTPWRRFNLSALEQENSDHSLSPDAAARLTSKLSGCVYQSYQRGVAQEGLFHLELMSPGSPPLEVADWQALPSLPGLSSLALEGPDVTDATLLQLANLEDFAGGVVVRSNRISDAGIAHLASMSELRKLVVVANRSDRNQSGPAITERGIRLLGRIRLLGTLVLEGEFVDDFILAEVSEFPALRRVALSGGRFSATGLRFLVSNATIDRISLPNNRDDLQAFMQSRLQWKKVLGGSVTIWSRNR